jgi:hypothetical protein
VLTRGFVAGLPDFESSAPQEFALFGHVDGTEADGLLRAKASPLQPANGHVPGAGQVSRRWEPAIPWRRVGVLTGVLVTVEDVRLDAAIPSLP